MKTILVDAVHTFIHKIDGLNMEMFDLLESYWNRKIVLSWANEQQIIKFRLDKLPYEMFTMKHDPEKSDPLYYSSMLDHYWLQSQQTLYVEHNADAVRSAESVWIITLHYTIDSTDILKVRKFIDMNK